MEGYSSSEGGVVIQPFSGMPKEALGRPLEGVDVVGARPGHRASSARRPASAPSASSLNAAEAIGEIVGRDGLSSFEGYYANDEANAERGRNGWYWTGDLGYRDEDGTFYFAGSHLGLAAGRRRELRRRARRADHRAPRRRWRPSSCTRCPTPARATR